MGLLEAPVRTSIIASLGTQLQASMTGYFAGNLKSTSLQEVIHDLDQKHAFLSDQEERRTLEDFRTYTRTKSISLQSYLMGWKSMLEKAIAANYKPASDISDTLQKRANLTTEQYARVTAAVRKEELERGIR